MKKKRREKRVTQPPKLALFAAEIAGNSGAFVELF